jgi:hypothetical protein
MTARTVYSKLFTHWLSDEHYFKVTATVYDEKFNNSDQKLDTPLIIHILEFIHPYLYCIISKKLISYCGYPLEILPVSILISLNSIETLESFKKVLLGYKFNYASFTAFVASWGDFETIKWFYSHGSCTMFHNDVLANIAKRGDKKTLMKYFKLYKDYGNICDIVPHPSDLAFEVGNLEIYKWIHQNGCPWNEHTNWLKLLTSDQDKSAFVDFAFQSGGVLKANSKKVWNEIQEMVWRSERCVRPRHRNPMDDSTSESDR